MKLSFNTKGWPGWPLDEVMPKLAELGYDGMEIAAHPAYFPDALLTAEEARRLSGHASGAGLSITNLDLSPPLVPGAFLREPSLISPYPEHQDMCIASLQRAIAFAADLGAGLVSFPAGQISPFMARAAAMELMIEGLEICLECAIEHDVSLAIEPRPGHLIGSYTDYIELAQSFDYGNFGLCYDLAAGHAVFEDSLGVIASADADLLHIHIADAARRDETHLIPGEGELDLGALMQMLEALGGDAAVSIELSSRQTNGEAAAIKALRALLGEHTPQQAGAVIH